MATGKKSAPAKPARKAESAQISGSSFAATPFTGGDAAFRRKQLRGLAPEVPFAGAPSFLRRKYARPEAPRARADAREEEPREERPDLFIVGVPFDTAVTNRPGARFGPRAIRAASAMIACWSRIYPWDFDPMLRIGVADYGDIAFDFGRPAETPEALRRAFAEILAGGAATLALGGDHFITYPILRAYAERFGTLSLIHFDAHSDSWRDQQGRIDHGTMFFHAAREGLVDPARSAQIGLRTYNPETHGYNVFDARSVKERGPRAVAAEVKRIVGTRSCYLTFDIDCLDPAYAPGTGTPEAGGLTFYEAQELLHGLRGVNLVGMDLVEVSPPYDHAEMTALAGATIAFMEISLFAEKFPVHPREEQRAAQLARTARLGRREDAKVRAAHGRARKEKAARKTAGAKKTARKKPAGKKTSVKKTSRRRV